ncbi:MAG TPA: 2-isopropylmalate synthase [Planctomycetota bacterium]|nr:2-isopropylmalate synthase [Planctomycetota bacterium]HRR83207.1 2-isopropylmalate synthase [Planctomycetota bacterium]HRT97418.1 2-isopropylmalate synthase [Planctomycetota bacterium]
MLRWNKHTRTLEQEEHHFELQDIAEPNLFRDTFPYVEVPRIPFDHRRVPMWPPEEIWITDTTFRDGQQARPPYSVEQIVQLYKFLHQLGGPNGIIRQSEFFLYSDKDKEAVRRCLDLGYRYPEITGWIRATASDFKLVKQMGLRETGILTSCSDYHIFLKLGKTRKQALDMYLGIVKSAIEQEIIPRCHFEDLTRADFLGFVVPFAQELMKLAQESRRPVKIRCCDTLGLGVCYPGSSVPRCVQGVIYGLIQYANVPSAWLEWHGHNDFYKVVTNAGTAWLYGCAAANGTLLGIGERTGNPPIEALAIEYTALRGDANGMDLSVITQVADYYRRVIGYEPPRSQPYVGADFNTTAAGIHADGLRKNPEIYTIFDTERILGVPPTIAITDKSGVAGIAAWVDFELRDRGVHISKDHPGVIAIKDAVDAQFAGCRLTAMSREELLALARKHLPEYFSE